MWIGSVRVKRANEVVDLLFMSTGHLGTGQVFTEEGLDSNHVLRYYARMGFITNLLPALKLSRTLRVVSILAAGKETQISADNLDLCKSYSFTTAGFYATTMTTLALSHLAAQHPSISFLHVFPGFVPMPIHASAWGGIVGSIVSMLLWPFTLPLNQSGEWSLFVATSAAFRSREYREGDEGVPLVDGVSTVRGADGVVGSGGYILNYDGRDVTKRGLMDGFRKTGLAGVVWEHMLETSERVGPSEE